MRDDGLEPVGTRLLFQNNDVRVWTLELEPGEETEIHTHQCDYVYVVVEGGATQVNFSDGREQIARDTAGESFYRTAGGAHSLKNVGARRYVNVIVELLATGES